MTTPERCIILSIIKIFNWSQPQSSNIFEFSFFSLKTSSLIISKTVKAKVHQQEVNFNYTLRVAYQPDENEVVIRLANWQQNRNCMAEIADFTLNLDHLSNKQVQFFTFGKNDQVLKIGVGDSDRQDRQNIRSSRSGLRQGGGGDNQQFIRQKEEFLRRIGNTTSSSRLKGDSSSVKSFSEQAMDLMAEIKSIKKHKNSQRAGGIEEQFNDYYNQPNKYSQQARIHKSMNKSNSASHLGVRGLARPARPRPDEDSSAKSTKSQKHKLLLNNLEMVACQNEYYEDFQPTPVRKAGTSSLNRKRVFKSQLY